MTRILRRAGMYVGSNLNESEDALDFAPFWQWALVGESSKPGRDETAAAFAPVLRQYLAGCPESAPAWGWKLPTSMYVLPLLDEVTPRLRFLHVVRDGRDMAFSPNQNQVRRLAAALLRDGLGQLVDPVRSIALWNLANLTTADYGEHRMRHRYLRIRFEDLCAASSSTIATILAFSSLEGEPDLLSDQVEPPSSLGR